MIHKHNVTVPNELFCHRLSVLPDVLFHPELSCDYHVAGQVAVSVAKLVKTIAPFESKCMIFESEPMKFK